MKLLTAYVNMGLDPADQGKFYFSVELTLDIKILEFPGHSMVQH